MVIYEQDIDLPPDISQKLLQPITEEQANLLLADAELRAECERTGVDLGMLIKNWRLMPEDRLRQTLKAAKFVAKLDPK